MGKLDDLRGKLEDATKEFKESQLYKSVMRHGRVDSPRNRTLAVLSNVFLHLHPPKLPRHGTRVKFTWCMGGITFFLFLVLTITGILLTLTLLLSFTGYLLPYDQLGFWAVTVGTNMARATPGLGSEGPFGPQLGMTPFNDVRFGLLGGSIVDANALLRSYIWHCIGIPVVASLFMAVHFWRIRKDGGISGPAPVMLESEMKAVKK